MDLLSGRGRRDAAPAQGAHLGPARAYPRGESLRPGFRPGLDGRTDRDAPGATHPSCFTTRLHRGRKGERKSFAERDYIALLDSVHQQLRAPIILVWDRLNTHVSAVMRELIAARAWLRVVLLPGYAPDLNPVEAVWSHVKRSLANLTAGSLDRLAALARNRLKSLQYQPGILDGFIAATGLALQPP